MKLSEKIARSIGIDEAYVNIIATRNNLYSKYYIQKKSGGKREILQPSKELKVIQRWILKNILNEFPISEYSCAYSKGDSVKKNAEKHRNANYLLHTDIINFFPSIDRRMMCKYFKKNQEIVRSLQLNKEDERLILDICLYQGKYLVVGSVASPKIANMIMYQFDTELMKKLDELGRYCYTRYADDIVISSHTYIDEEIINVVSELMNEYGFEMNQEKTYFMNKKRKRQVTGVVIDNNENIVTVGTKKYRMLKRMLYMYLVKGAGNVECIKGYLSYVKGVNIQQYNQLEKIYRRYDREKILFKE